MRFSSVFVMGFGSFSSSFLDFDCSSPSNKTDMLEIENRRTRRLLSKCGTNSCSTVAEMRLPCFPDNFSSNLPLSYLLHTIILSLQNTSFVSLFSRFLHSIFLDSFVVTVWSTEAQEQLNAHFAVLYLHATLTSW